MEDEAVHGFFACYLLCSQSPRHKGHTYIGFTVNPRRRIRQHNGEIRCGAWRTKRKRPWEMILCIYGFPTNVSALQFEWAWQHPKESLAVRKAASSFKSLSGVANKIKLAHTMLTLPSWQNLNLTVNFFSTKYVKYSAGCHKLPDQMKVKIGPMDELPCYSEGLVLDGDNDEDFGDYDNDTDETMKEPSITNVMENGCSRARNNDPCWENGYDYHHPTDPPSPTTQHIGYSLEPAIGDDIMGGSIKSSDNCCQFTQRNDLEQPVTPLCPRRFDNKIVSCFMGESNSAEKGTDVIISLLSPEPSVRRMQSPPSACIIRSCSKRASACSKIIDLTNSPVVIHL